MTLISIVMPAFNAETWLQESVHSVLKQSYQEWELLITNDGSTDSTPTILENFTDQRIRVFHQPNKGVSAARNLALSAARGEYVTFLDADDILPPDSLKSRHRAVSTDNVDLVFGCVAKFEKDPNSPIEVWRPRPVPNLLKSVARIDERVFCNSSFLMRTKQVGRLDTTMTHSEDLDLLIRYVAHNRPKYSILEDIVYHYRLSPGTAMSNLSGLERGYWQVYQKVRRMNSVSSSDKAYLRRRLTRIMFLSYLSQKRFPEALRTLYRFYVPPTVPCGPHL